MKPPEHFECFPGIKSDSQQWYWSILVVGCAGVKVYRPKAEGLLWSTFTQKRNNQLEYSQQNASFLLVLPGLSTEVSSSDPAFTVLLKVDGIAEAKLIPFSSYTLRRPNHLSVSEISVRVQNLIVDHQLSSFHIFPLILAAIFGASHISHDKPKESAHQPTNPGITESLGPASLFLRKVWRNMSFWQKKGTAQVSCSSIFLKRCEDVWGMHSSAFLW